MAAQLGGQPVLILKEDTERTTGKDAVRMNIQAGIAVADAIRSTLGPKGMDKMLVDENKDVAITDSGATILKSINIKHPAAKMLVDVAKTQEEVIGDGSTIAVLLVGELLKKAEELLDKNIHATSITKGYGIASKKALKIIDEIAIDITKKDLRNIALTSLSGKISEKDREHLVNVAIEAINIAEKRENVRIDYRSGGRIGDTELIKGMMIDLGKGVHPGMPKKVRDAKILLVNRDFEVKKIEHAKIEMTDVGTMRAFTNYKENILEKAVDMIAKAGANVILCQKNIDDVALYYLAKAGILGVRDVEEDVLKKIAKATGGKIISNVKDVSKGVLGKAGLVEETKIGLEEMMYIKGCKNPKAVGILVRGGMENVAMEVKRKMEDLIAVLSNVLEDEKVVTGGGVAEIEIARRLRSEGRKIKGREQLAIRAFADAMEVIPKTLAANAGMDSIDTLVKMKAGDSKSGLNVYHKKIEDVYKQGIIDPIETKKLTIKSASEVANMILRIDDILLAKGFGEEEGKTGGMPSMPPACGMPPL